MYITYSEYKGYGGTLSESAFSRCEYNARREVDKHTFGRLKNEAEIPESVKMLMFELIGISDSLISAYSDNGKKISSEKVEGYSVSYTDSECSETDGFESAAESLIERYLSGETMSDGTPLLYRGCG